VAHSAIAISLQPVIQDLLFGASHRYGLVTQSISLRINLMEKSRHYAKKENKLGVIQSGIAGNQM
jgi:hypothetical protein